MYICLEITDDCIRYPFYASDSFFVAFLRLTLEFAELTRGAQKFPLSWPFRIVGLVFGAVLICLRAYNRLCGLVIVFLYTVGFSHNQLFAYRT